MTSGVPWQVEGVGQEARESAREAARRSGMSVGEWLDSVISDRARSATPAPHPSDAAGKGSPPGRGDTADHKRPLDQGGQLDQLSRLNAGKTYLRPNLRRDEPTGALSDVISQLDRRLDQLLTPARQESGASEQRADTARAAAQPPADRSKSLQRALQEIAERQRALQVEAEPAEIHAPRTESPPTAPAPDLSNLEQQLRRVTTVIETLQPCGVNAALETLRDDLAEIGLMLNEAMPRQAIEALEAEIRGLSERLRMRGSADAEGSIAGIERGLAEVRDALRVLTPAENLLGVEETVRELSRKIDRVASRAEDPGVMAQLESAIAGLRGIATQVASDDVLARLSDEVHGLAAKVDQMASSASSGADLMSTLEQRLSSMAQALEQRPQAGTPMAGDFDAVVRGITDRLEELGHARPDAPTLGPLEQQITSLVERLDRSNARFDHLEAIEQGLAGMMAELERQRHSDLEHSVTAALPDVTSLRQDVVDTKNSLDSMRGALEQLVDRLTMIESDMHDPAPGKPAARPIAGMQADTAAAPLASPLRAAQPAMAPAPNPPEHRPIDPNLPPDHPLEPGATRGRAGTSPADRIAASEAALGAAKPTAVPEAGNKSNFIAAARRAAQTANSEGATAGEKRAPAPADDKTHKEAGGWGSRVRSLLVAVSVVLIVLSSVHLVVSLFTSGDESGQGSRAPEVQSPPIAAPDEPSPDGPSAPPATAPTASPPGRQSLIGPAETPATPATLPAETAQQPPHAAPVPASSGAAGKDVTGSISRSATPMPGVEAGPASPAHATRVDKLPAAIGGALRSAAAKGDAAAEYEIAQRFAEGRGVPENLAEAADWYDRAAKQGLPIAQFRLGAFYEKGFGVKKDLDMARRLYTAAAEAGNAKAMHNLAVLYAEGIDGKPDYQNATKWFRRAADYGLPDSQYNLGILYGRGIGMPANLAEAYKWFSLAAREGDQEAVAKRDEVGRRMDAQSLAAAKAAAQAWTALEQPEAATQAATPPGGWDSTGTAAPINPKPRAGASKSLSAGR